MYYSKENFEELIDWLFTNGILEYLSSEPTTDDALNEIKTTIEQVVNLSLLLKETSEKSGYQYENLKKQFAG
jgi:hypothetical protein